ncbi:hypothetical protein EI71_00799 [Anaeroplasma bactoclasticum]|jgi:hypothetical protein|uniref:Uncharacterized protein n=1 Tax=Anaeroplasma bactoclasticum TaxID=2088 RepID=A0A397RUG1_9MOLU|nr:hypothetical protein [Anaeroplasma bactoclasticum]RIA77823.1 hypothetical protein EI71_00799 [Anaeroplasma bactoclasticum]
MNAMNARDLFEKYNKKSDEKLGLLLKYNTDKFISYFNRFIEKEFITMPKVYQMINILTIRFINIIDDHEYDVFRDFLTSFNIEPCSEKEYLDTYDILLTSDDDLMEKVENMFKSYFQFYYESVKRLDFDLNVLVDFCLLLSINYSEDKGRGFLDSDTLNFFEFMVEELNDEYDLNRYMIYDEEDLNQFGKVCKDFIQMDDFFMLRTITLGHIDNYKLKRFNGEITIKNEFGIFFDDKAYKVNVTVGVLKESEYTMKDIEDYIGQLPEELTNRIAVDGKTIDEFTKRYHYIINPDYIDDIEVEDEYVTVYFNKEQGFKLEEPVSKTFFEIGLLYVYNAYEDDNGDLFFDCDKDNQEKAIHLYNKLHE